jgi:hydrogenase small subunit
VELESARAAALGSQLSDEALAMRPGSLIERLAAKGFNRREFLRIASMAAAAVGLPASFATEAAAVKKRPTVLWLHFQECTGCTETLLRCGYPELTEVILETISLDYHETLLAPAGEQAEAALHKSMEENAGKYVLVVEGAIPLKDDGIYCKVANKTAKKMVEEVAAKAAAVIAIGSCASFGGIQAADPNPTGATGVPTVLAGKTVVTLPGCPANPYNLLGVVLQFVTFGTLPALDNLGRPMFAYARTIHEDCPRRPHFDAGRYVEKFGDAGHKLGYCLYKTGCKGPATHANCSLKHFCDVDGAWPIGIGHPCVGCTEQELVFRVPIHDTVKISRPTPPDLYPPILTQHEGPGSTAVAVGAGIVGAAVGAGLMMAKNVASQPESKGPGGDQKKEG